MTPTTSSSTSNPSLRPVPAALQIDAEDLSQRIALATPADTCKGMFLNGLFDASKRIKGQPAYELLKDLAGTRKFVDFFNYPIVDFLPLAWKAAEQIGGGTTSPQLENGVRTLGHQAASDFLATAVGKTLLLLAGNEPRRLMNSLPAGYKTAVSYGTRSLTWHSEKRCTFAMRRDFMPHPYHEGVLRQALEAVGAKQVTAVGKRVGVLDTDYEVSWT